MENMIVLGASPKPDRYSYKAVRSLIKRGYHVVAIGRNPGTIEEIQILTGKPPVENVHTVLLYVSPEIQTEYYDYLIDLKPKRIIFNPGTENNEFGELAAQNHIECVFDCALIMLSTKSF